MKFSAILLSQALLAASALAAPKGHGLAARVAARNARSRLSHPNIPAPAPETVGEEKIAPNRTNVDYSSNWSGAVLTSPPSGSTFTSVSAQFTVPSPSLPQGSQQSSSASAWVGIDGDTYTNAILQTGVDFNVDSNGQVSYDAWYEWYPDYAHDFTGISFKSGDVVSVSVTSSSNSQGTAVIENLTNGQKVTKTLSAPSSGATLGGQNAEWIVEDFESGGGLVPFANFGTVKFTKASAGTSSGSSVGTDGADILDIQQNGKVLTSASTPSSSEVDVTYTGGN